MMQAGDTLVLFLWPISYGYAGITRVPFSQIVEVLTRCTIFHDMSGISEIDTFAHVPLTMLLTKSAG